MQPNQPISSLGGEPSTWPARAPTYHPFGVRFEPGNLIAQTFTLWRADLGRLLGISALPYLLLCVAGVVGFFGLFMTVGVGGFADLFSMSGAYTAAALGGVTGFMALCMLLFTAAQVGTYVAVEEQVRGEARRVGVGTVLVTGLSAMPSVIGVYMAATLVGSVIALPAVSLGIAAVAAESVALGVFGALLFVPTMIALAVFGLRVVALAPVVAVIEEAGAIKAMRRAIELTRGNGVDLFIAGLVMFAVLIGINMVFGILGMIPVLGILVQLVVGVLMSSISSVWLFLVYAGLRDRAGL